MEENDNYYCWDQPVFSMSSGKVIYIYDQYEDNFGNKPNSDSDGNNVVVIENATSDFYHFYAHFKKDGISVSENQLISPGDKLGVVGNSGASSEPHLHVGIARKDSHGFIRSLPMTFQKVKNGAGQTVSGVLVTDDFYASV
jgi:murein DD-endopeptidase MepM/ murein hydrolase activator NlpD